MGTTFQRQESRKVRSKTIFVLLLLFKYTSKTFRGFHSFVWAPSRYWNKLNEIISWNTQRCYNIDHNVVSTSEMTVHIKVLVIAFKMKFSTYATLWFWNENKAYKCSLAFVCDRAFENESFIPGTSEPNAIRLIWKLE